MSLISVNVGLPREVEWQGKVVHTAIWKQPVPGRVIARRLNLDDDGQGDLAGHGGEHRAVMVYQLDSYRYWEAHFQRHDFEYGQFGENLTVDCLPDDEVCIGDRYRIGSALFEVTQPRVICYRVGIRMNNPQMPALLVSHKRPGFYFRVIEEGEIGAGDEIVKVAGGQEHVSVAEIDALLTCLAIRAINWNEPSASLHLVQVGKDRWKLWSRRTSWAAIPASPHPPRHRRRGTGFGHCEWRR